MTPSRLFVRLALFLLTTISVVKSSWPVLGGDTANAIPSHFFNGKNLTVDPKRLETNLSHRLRRRSIKSGAGAIHGDDIFSLIGEVIGGLIDKAVFTGHHCPARSGKCLDGSASTPCCGKGSCNAHCWNCDGGCREVPENTSVVRIYTKSNFGGSSTDDFWIRQSQCLNLPTGFQKKGVSLEKVWGDIQIHDRADCQGRSYCVWSSYEDLSQIVTKGQSWKDKIVSLSFCNRLADAMLNQAMPEFTLKGEGGTSQYFHSLGHRFCLKMPSRWEHGVRAVDTHQTCIRIWSGPDCTGYSNSFTPIKLPAIASQCDFHWDTRGCWWNTAPKHSMLSVSDCIRPYIHPEPLAPCNVIKTTTENMTPIQESERQRSITNCVIDVWAAEIQHNYGNWQHINNLFTKYPSVLRENADTLVESTYQGVSQNILSLMRVIARSYDEDEYESLSVKMAAKLLDLMTQKDDLYNPWVVMLANFAGESLNLRRRYTSDKAALKDRLPRWVKGLLFSTQVTIESAQYLGYTLYGSRPGNMYLYPDENYSGGLNQRWKVRYVGRQIAIMLENVQNQNSLYSDAHEHAYGDTNTHDDQFLWEVIPQEKGEFFVLRNKKFGSYLQTKDLDSCYSSQTGRCSTVVTVATFNQSNRKQLWKIY